MSPDDERHGTTAGHQAHRRAGQDACNACVAAKTRYEKTRHVYGNRMVPALGTRRRIHALMALGHSGADIANKLGVTYQAVHKLEHDTAPRIFAATAARVAAVYDELCMTLPTSPHRHRIRRKAQARGYAPPLAYDNIDTDERPHGVTHDVAAANIGIDINVVDRILSGDWRLPCTPAEKTAVCETWTARGGSLNDLSRLTGWRTARYWKAAA